MNIHKNARLTPYSRAEAARRVAERAGLISCQSGVARSIPLLGEPEALPILRSSEIQSVKSSVQGYWLKPEKWLSTGSG
jgi:hypothetical protein